MTEQDRGRLPETKGSPFIPGASYLAAMWLLGLTVSVVLPLLDVVSWRTGAAVALGVTGLVFALVILNPGGRRQ